VYGGAISIMIGAYSLSFSFFSSSSAQSGDTYCSGCTMNVSDVAIANSVAASITTGKMLAAFYALQSWRS
jgi:hypothetical protein